MSGGASRCHSTLGFWFVLANSFFAIATQEIDRTNQDQKDEWRGFAPPLIFLVLCPKQNLRCYININLIFNLLVINQLIHEVKHDQDNVLDMVVSAPIPA